MANPNFKWAEKWNLHMSPERLVNTLSDSLHTHLVEICVYILFPQHTHIIIYI